MRKKGEWMHTVLVLDDDDLVLKMFLKALGLFGFRTFAAKTPQQALELLRRHAFDAVVLEVFRADNQGMRMLATFRQNCPEARIIATTGGSGMAGGAVTLETIKQQGADVVLRKPVQMDELVRNLADIRERPPAQAERN